MGEEIARRRMIVLAALALAAWMVALFSLAFGVTVVLALLDRTSAAPVTVSCPSTDYHPALFGTVRPCGFSRS